MKHVPLRSCIVCRAEKQKSELMRIVHRPDGTFVYDANGREPGRGAYICKSKECISNMVRRRALCRAFKTDAAQSVSEELCKTLSAALDSDR